MDENFREKIDARFAGLRSLSTLNHQLSNARTKPVLRNYHSDVLRRPSATALSRHLPGRGVQVSIESFEVIKGRMRRRALALVLEWAALHREELHRAWDVAPGR